MAMANRPAADLMSSSAVVGVAIGKSQPPVTSTVDLSSSAQSRPQSRQKVLTTTSTVANMPSISNGKSPAGWHHAKLSSYDSSDENEPAELENGGDETVQTNKHKRKETSEFNVHSYVDSIVKSAMLDSSVQTKRTQRNNAASAKPVRTANGPGSAKAKRSRSADDRKGRTVVQPFNLTQSNKKTQKSRAMEEYEAVKREKELREMAEVAKSGKFRASQPPPAVYLPLYDEIVSQKQARSSETREFCKQVLLAQVQPFEFEQREAAKLRKSAEAQRDSATKQTKQVRKSLADVKAMYEREEEKRLENEILRDLNRKRHSEKLLLTSHSPVAEKRDNSAQERTPSFQPKVNKSVPDFDTAYQKFLQQGELYRTSNDATRCHPFALHTDARIRERVALKNVEKELKEMLDSETKERVQKRPGSLHTFFQDDVPAVLLNKSVELRMSKNREKAQEVRKQQAELRAKRVQQQMTKMEAQRKLSLSRSITDDAPDSQSEPAAEPVPDPFGKQQAWLQKSQELKRQQRSRQKMYEDELRKIHSKLNERPTLVEQERLYAAKQAAERRYKQTLKLAGVDTSLLETTQTATASALDSPKQSSEAEAVLD